MSTFKAAYINEIYKICKKKKIVVGAILSIIAVALASLISASLNMFTGIKISGSFSIMVLSVLNVTLIPLFMAFVCIDMFNGEFTNQTIKFTLTQPASRFKIFSAKALAAATFIFANLMFVMVVSIIIEIFLSGFSLSVFSTIIAYIASFFPLFVLALMVIVISNFTRGSAGAFMLSVLLFLVLVIAGFVFPQFQSFFFTSTFDWYKLFINNFVNIQKIFRVFLILSGYGIMFYTVGYYLFDKKEI